jgi:DNA-binding LytR/AlgR family response regulator
MINCIAVDDEPLALELLEDNIKRIPFLNLVQKCSNAFEAIEALQKGTVDLIFLDIEMPNLTGISFIKSLKDKPMVIFITAYEKYALAGFELDVLDYLLKPVPFDRFLKAVNKACEYFNFIKQPDIKQDNQTSPDYIFVKADYKIIKIFINDILYVEGLKDYIKIFCGGKPVLTLSSLKAIEARLSPDKFVRVHKSFIVAVSKIESIGKSRIKIGEADIPVSDNYHENLFKIIGKNQL